MARGRRNDLLAPAVEERVRADQQRYRPHLNDAREGGLDLVVAAGMEGDDRSPRCPSCDFGFLQVDYRGREVRVQEHRDGRCGWNQIVQQP